MIDGIEGSPAEQCEYQSGDRVLFLGAEGTVKNAYDQYWHKYIVVVFDGGREMMFERDGRYIPEWNEKLQVIGKTKPKVKKHLYAYKGKYGNTVSSYMCEEVATSFFNTDFNSNYVKLPWTEKESDAE